MMPAVRYRADLAEEHPDGNLVGVEAVTELEERIEELYEEGTEIFDAGERMSQLIAEAIKDGRLAATSKLAKAAERWKAVTNG